MRGVVLGAGLPQVGSGGGLGPQVLLRPAGGHLLVDDEADGRERGEGEQLLHDEAFPGAAEVTPSSLVRGGTSERDAGWMSGGGPRWT